MFKNLIVSDKSFRLMTRNDDGPQEQRIFTKQTKKVFYTKIYFCMFVFYESKSLNRSFFKKVFED